MTMNKDAALTTFVKKHFDFLTSEEFDRKLYKRYHREFFFESHNRKYGMPSPNQSKSGPRESLGAERSLINSDMASWITLGKRHKTVTL